MDVEKCWYESSPFIYTAVGGYMLGRADTGLLLISSLLLLIAGGTIRALRRRHGLIKFED
jgi:hypothetical protein